MIFLNLKFSKDEFSKILLRKVEEALDLVKENQETNQEVEIPKAIADFMEKFGPAIKNEESFKNEVLESCVEINKTLEEERQKNIQKEKEAEEAKKKKPKNKKPKNKKNEVKEVEKDEFKFEGLTEEEIKRIFDESKFEEPPEEEKDELKNFEQRLEEACKEKLENPVPQSNGTVENPSAKKLDKQIIGKQSQK